MADASSSVPTEGEKVEGGYQLRDPNRTPDDPPPNVGSENPIEEPPDSPPKADSPDAPVREPGPEEPPRY